MSKELFQTLCNDIEGIVGEESFKSEEYLSSITNKTMTDLMANIFHAHLRSTGGVISGEIRLAITLRILGGGTYMDMALLMETSFNHAHNIVKETVCNWLTHPAFYPIDGIAYCSDDEKMSEVATQFSAASNFVLNGCIGAVDGWVVKVQRLKNWDGAPDPNSFYSRKGYYAINVQAIIDKKKLFEVLSLGVLSTIQQHSRTQHCTSGSRVIGNQWLTMDTFSFAILRTDCNHSF